MPDDDSTSLAQETFRGYRDTFEADFERFLTSPATPVEARRAEGIETIRRLGAIARRLRAQGVL